MTKHHFSEITSRRGLHGGAAAAAAFIFCGVVTSLCAAACHRFHERRSDGPLINLDRYQLSFDEEFKQLDMSDRQGTGARWYNHTPWAGDFGEARFAGPEPDGPFSITPQGLDITARKGSDSRWTSGLISSRDRDGAQGRGFTQAYGYFEIKAKLPTGQGLWPGFWLIGVDKATSAAEIDVIEDFGGFPEYYHCVAHIFRNSGQSWSKDFLIHVPRGILSRQYNLFGVQIDPKTTRFTFNRHVVAEMPTPPEYRQPFYILADLALGGGWPTATLNSPQTMSIASIRAFAPLTAEVPP
jgi:beta-glucanase (GH16 family)